MVISGNHLIVMEFKIINIDYLAIGNARSRHSKANALSEPNVSQALETEFVSLGGCWIGIREWIEGDVGPQLKGYVTSTEVKALLGGSQVPCIPRFLLLSPKRFWSGT